MICKTHFAIGNLVKLNVMWIIFNYRLGHCHIYSQPYTMTRLDGITNCFRGDQYTSVTKLTVYDVIPFEHSFF